MAETFGNKFWRLIAEEMARRQRAGQQAPTKEERIAMLDQLHKEAVATEISEYIRTHPNASEPTQAPKKERRQKPMNAMSEDEFIASLEAQFPGVDVRREIGKCQYWCKVNIGSEASRKRILNWIMKSDQRLTFNGTGATSRPGSKPIMTEPPHWREWLNANRPESVYCTGGPMGFKQWADLDYTIRKYISDEMAKSA